MEILDYTFYPWGNAYYNISQCGGPVYSKDRYFCWVEACGNNSLPATDCYSGTVVCQHGQKECDADTLELCAMHIYPAPAAYAPFVYCFEGVHESDWSAAPSCAALTGLSWDLLSACFEDEALTGRLEADAARATAALGSAKQGTPWVLVNGEVLEETDALLTTVCKAYKGEPPAGCAAAEVHRASNTKALC